MANFAGRRSLLKTWYEEQVLGSRDDAVVKALASHQHGSGLILPNLTHIWHWAGPSAMCGYVCWLLPCSNGFSLGPLVFLPPQKPTFSNTECHLPATQGCKNTLFDTMCIQKYNVHTNKSPSKLNDYQYSKWLNVISGILIQAQPPIQCVRTLFLASFASSAGKKKHFIFT